MLKQFTGILLAICAVTSLAACGASAPSSNETPAGSGPSVSGSSEGTSSPARTQTVYLNYGAGTSGSTINSVVLAHTQNITASGISRASRLIM